jgi:hypothetical protein
MDQGPDAARGVRFSSELVSPLGANPSRDGTPVKEQPGSERDEDRTTAAGMAGTRLASAVARAQASTLTRRRRFQGTVTKSARRTGWTGLRFSVMAQLHKVSLVRCRFLNSSIGFSSAQQIIT